MTCVNMSRKCQHGNPRFPHHTKELNILNWKKNIINGINVVLQLI